MGWVSSPPFFCAATETATDIANWSLASSASVPPHPLSYQADHPDNPVVPSPRPAMGSITSPALSHLPPPVAPTPALSQRKCPTSPLAYVDVYMDDFIGLAQGHPGLRQHVRSTLMHAIHSVFRPLSTHEASSFRKEPISIKKLNKGDAKWATRQTILGWIIDSVAESVELPEHRSIRLMDILTSLLSRKRISLSKWQKYLGELRSMILAIPGGKGLFSTLYTTLSQPSHRIHLTHPIRDALLDFKCLAHDLYARPTRFGEIVDTVPVAYGSADACAQGCGGIWFSADPTFAPILWRQPFPLHIQQNLISSDNPHGTITNSDLELLAQVASHDILLQQRDCRECTIATFTDNVPTRSWLRKGSHSSLGPSAYLLRILSFHQRFFRYRSTNDYIPGPANTMADVASRFWHLSDTELLSHFNVHFPQQLPWRFQHLRPQMHSALIMSLQCKRSEPALFLPAPNLAIRPGFSGLNSVPPFPSTQLSATFPINFHSSKSLPNVIDKASLPPVVNQSDLAQWKQPSGPLLRRWPVWGPRTRG